jgi:predicted Ser/Thr protein kinase
VRYGLRFIAMEYVEGRTLRSLLTQPLSIEEAVDISEGVAEALAAAHAAYETLGPVKQ